LLPEALEGKGIVKETEQLSAVLENSNAAIWSVDRNCHLIIGNSTFHEQCRAGLGRAIEKGESVLMDFLSPAEKEEWQGYYDRALRGEPYCIERQRRHSPRPTWTEYHLGPIQNEIGDCVGVTVVAHDITERKQAEEVFFQQSAGVADLLAISQDFLQMSAADLDYQKITDDLLKLSGGKYAAFNLFAENGIDFYTVALSGVSAFIRKVTAVLGFEIIGKNWPNDPALAKKINDQTITRLPSVLDITKNIISPSIMAVLIKAYEPGEVIIVRINVDGIAIGDFTIMMPPKTSFEADDLVSIYARQVGLLLQRAQTETVLRESQARYVLTTHAGNIGVWDWDLETGKIYLDPSLKAMLGYADDEIENHLDDWGQYVHPDDSDQVMAEATAHLEGLKPQYEVEHRMLHKDGGFRWFLARGTAMRDKAGNPYRVVGTDVDITERKQAEEVFLQQSAGVVDLLAISQDFLQTSAADIDFQTITDTILRLSEGQYASFNLFEENGKDFQTVALSGAKEAHLAKAAAIVGQDFMGKKWPHDPVRAQKIKNQTITRFPTLMDLTGNVIPPSLIALLHETFNLGETIVARIHVDEKSLGDFTIMMPAKVSFTADHLVSMYTHQVGLLLQRKQAEEAIEKERREVQTILDAAPVMIAYKNKEGQFMRMNAAFVEFTGVPADELIGKTPSEFVNPEAAQQSRNHDLQVMRTGTPTLNQLVKLSSVHSQKEIWALYSKLPYYDSDGSIIGTISYVLDIDERKQAEEIAIASQKMASIGNLAAGMAHEINSPLQIVTGLSERLTRNLNADQIDPAQFLTDIERINKSGWRIANIVRSLLTYSRQTANAMQTNHLNAIVEDTLLLIEHQLKSWSSITITRQLAEEMPPINCDSSSITQVIINLLQNARDAMPEGGGEITIHTAYDSVAQHFILQVHNNGNPIPEEIQSKIFEPFFTTKDVGKGTGLGLSIVHGIVAAHGGEITVKSAQGEGATFSIQLPPEPPQQPHNNPDSGRYQSG
jgi:PAS domain S-box-containing protein